MRLRRLLLLIVFIAFWGCANASSRIQQGKLYEVRSELPNLHINRFAQDKVGYMWIATAKGLCRYNGYEYFNYVSIPDNPRSLPSEFIISLFADSKGDLWVATDNGLCRYNYDTDDFTRLLNQKNELSPMDGVFESGSELLAYSANGIFRVNRLALSITDIATSNRLSVGALESDGDSNIWVGGVIGGGILVADSGFKKIRQVVIDKSMEVFCSYKTENGKIWFGTNKGVVAIDPSTQQAYQPNMWGIDKAMLETMAISFFHAVNSTEVLIGTKNRGLFLYNPKSGLIVKSAFGTYFFGDAPRNLTCCFADKDGNMWLGSFEKGFLIKTNTTMQFNSDYRLNALLKNRFVTRVLEDRSSNLWFGTREYGIIYYNTKTKTSREYSHTSYAPFAPFSNDFVQAMFFDSKGNLWVGYNQKLVWLEMNAAQDQIVSHKIFDINCDVVTISEDRQGRVWAGTPSSSGVLIYDINRLVFIENLHVDDRWNNSVAIIPLKSGEMLFSNFGQGLFLVNPREMIVRKMVVPPQIEMLANSAIYLYEDHKAQIWIGTYGRGLARYNRVDGSFAIFKTNDGLASNDVLTICEDQQNNLWMSTSYGISKYIPTTNTFSNYFDYDGTGGNQFHEKCLLKSSNGKLYFGGNHGITYFDPKDVVRQNREFKVVLEDLKILNISEPIGKKGGVIDKHISSMQSITLNHRQNIFSIDYSGLGFDSNERIRYAYRLVGLEEQWNYVHNYRRATYSNLSAGTYYFQVKAQNLNDSWDVAPTVLKIRIKAAPWLTTWAVIGYFILISLLVVFALNIYLKFKNNKEKLTFIRKKRQYEQQMTDINTRFFTNISHELRTPLSMIYGPVKKLIDQSKDSQNNYLLRLIEYNSDRMIMLIDQLMDFVRMESDTLKLTISPTDVLPLIERIVVSYSYFAQEKNIEVKVIAPSPAVEVWVDGEKVTKIVSNLLSNALKYTPECGHVVVRIEVEQVEGGKSLTVSVEDDGIGISDEELPLLFSRYNRLGIQNSSQNKVEGKGVGLNYVKSMVEKHRGSITATSRQPRGMNFSFTLPAFAEAYRSHEIVVPVATDFVEPVHLSDVPVSDNHTNHKQPSHSKARLLVAEDNPELRDFLRRLLEEDYEVYTACDGEQAFEICLEVNLDVILSDVVMPGVDGFELCKQVKNDPRLCHIPFVILTAKTMDVNKIEGYRLGTDAYINKPFIPELLKTVIANILANIELRRSAIVSGDGNLELAEQTPDVNPLDRLFLEKLYAQIDKRLSDTTLNVSLLGKELAFSRTGFYVKVKNLTGQSPIDLLRIYRLNKAAELIRTREYSISEIVFMTGFGSHSHFSSCFKKQFGVSPNKFLDRK